MVHEYVVTKKNLWRLRRTYSKCIKCGRLFRLGDKVISKHSRNRSSLLHKICYEKMFCEVD